MTTVLAWIAVVFIQVFALGFSFEAGQEEARNGGGYGWSILSLVFGILAVVAAWFLGGEA